MDKFSVVLSVYRGDELSNLEEAIKSVSFQSLKPSEILIGIDGPIKKEISEYLESLRQNPLFKIIEFKENRGLSTTRKSLIEQTSQEIIAVMDSDDISRPERFEKQLQILAKNDLDVVGGWIEEFEDNPKDNGAIRKVPDTSVEIIKLSKWRTPINHVTLMFKKEPYLEVGGYAEDMSYSEDWHLLVRMIQNKAKIYNLQEVLVDVRIDQQTFKRRRSKRQIKTDRDLIFWMYQINHIGVIELVFNIIFRTLYAFLPLKIAKKVYKRILRKR